MNKPIDLKALVEKLESINESDAYDGLYTLANEVAEMISGKIVLETQMHNHPYTPEQLESLADNYVTDITKHIRKVTQKNIQQHLRGGPRG